MEPQEQQLSTVEIQVPVLPPVEIAHECSQIPSCSSSSSASLRTAWVPGPSAYLRAAEPLHPNGSHPRVYEVWPQLGGRNRFLCGGFCVTGPPHDRCYNLCAWSFILLPSGFFFLDCAPLLWKSSPVLPIVTSLVFASTVVFLLLTSCTDPGILPRHELQVAVAGLESEVSLITGTDPVSIDTATSEPVCDLTPEQERAGYRWCRSCKVIRPPRASHCRDCDNCVMMFDHHCPFVNNCIGQRNYAFFQAFLISTGCLGLAVALGLCLYFHDRSEEGSSESALRSGWMLALALAMGTPTALMLLGVLGLMAFHIWLSCKGITTKEVFSGRISAHGRTLFHLRGPSMLHARDRVSFPLSAV